MELRRLLMASASFALAISLAGSVGNFVPRAQAQRAPQPESKLRHLIYIATPGDRGADGQSGVIVLDADHDFHFLKRIPYGLAASEMPGPKISGMAASVAENKIYITSDGGRMIAFDLKTDNIAWVFQGEKKPVKLMRPNSATSGCCERPWPLPDGRTLLVGSSYNNWWYLIDAHDGKVLGKIDTPHAPRAHNLTVTPDGKTAFLASLSPAPDANVAMVDIPSRKVLKYISFSDAPRPMTMNHDGSLIYVNVNNLDGFEIADTATGKMIKRVELPGEMWKAKWANPNNHYFGHGLPSHGIGMTPDESEIWVTDGANDAWQIWDNPGDGRNPVYNPSKTVPITPDVGSAWISMTNDGRLAFVGDGSIIDVKAHKVIGTMKDEYGRPIHAVEKILYMAFQDGRLVETSNQFAVGNTAAYTQRTAGGSQGRRASN